MVGKNGNLLGHPQNDVPRLPIVDRCFLFLGRVRLTCRASVPMFDPVNPMESTPLVINTFRERNLPIDRNKVLSVFSNAAGAAAHAKWVTEHITSELLLSQEEFTLYPPRPAYMIKIHL